MSEERSQRILSLILVPALITLAVSVVRLVGELQHWSPVFFSRAGGGGGAIVGIVWLIPIFAYYFARKILTDYNVPKGGGIIAHALIGIVVAIGISAFGAVVLKLPMASQFLLTFAGCVVAGVIAYRGWPALGRTLLAYGLAARVPVTLLMFFAIASNWGTHYDIRPKGFPLNLGTLETWFYIAVLPQLFLWVPFTIVIGALVGGITVLALGESRRAGA